MKRGINKPWLDHRGRHLPKEKLREISRNWDTKTWFAYGDSLEKGTEGVLMTSRRRRKIAECQSESLYEIYAQSRASNRLTKFIEELCQCLTSRQAHAVDLIFYQGRSIEEAARIMGLGKTTVYDHITRAISRLQMANTVRANDLMLMRGSENQNDDPLTPEEELFEVIKEETNRNYRSQFSRGKNENAY